MTSIVSHSALRFGAQPTQERRTQEAPTPEATPNLHAPQDAPQDAFHGTQPGMAPHPMQQQHENMIKQLQIKIQKFVHHVTKAIQILLGQDHEEPELKSAMKRFSRAIRSLAQSPELAQGAAQNLRKFQAVLIETSDMPEDQKNELRAEVARPVPAEHAQEIIPQAVANIFNTLSEELESPHVKDGLMETLNALPEMITSLHQANQGTPEEQHARLVEMRRIYNVGESGPEPANAEEIRKIAREALERKKNNPSAEEPASILQDLHTPGLKDQRQYLDRLDKKEKDNVLKLSDSVLKKHAAHFKELNKAEQEKFIKLSTVNKTNLAEASWKKAEEARKASAQG